MLARFDSHAPAVQIARRGMLAAACCLSVLAVGCATHAHQLKGIRDDYYSGNIEKSAETINHLIADDSKAADALKLDRAIVELSTGKPQAAEKTLREVRDRLDYLEQKDAREQVLSMVRDDQSLAWAGADYEKVLIRTYLSITNLFNGGGDANAYALQVDAKQNEIISRIQRSREGESTQLDFKRVALGPYVHAAILEEQHSNFDDNDRSRLKVVSWETSFRDGEFDLERARHGSHSEPGNGVLYVFCMVGRGPYQVEAAEVPTQVAMLIADRILSQVLKQELTPTVAPVKVPVVLPGRSLISEIHVLKDGQNLGATATITDVSQYAVQQAEANFPEVLARAVVRRTVKKGSMYAIKEGVGADANPAADLALTLTGIAWEATESADTRCWGLLPDQIQVLRLELPAGEHAIQLRPWQSGRAVGNGETVHVTIEDGRNTYLMGTIPDQHFVGEILNSSRQ